MWNEPEKVRNEPEDSATDDPQPGSPEAGKPFATGERQDRFFATLRFPTKGGGIRYGVGRAGGSERLAGRLALQRARRENRRMNGRDEGRRKSFAATTEDGKLGCGWR